MRGHGPITTHSPIRLDRAITSHAAADAKMRSMRRSAAAMAEDILSDDEFAEGIVREHQDEFPELTVQFLRYKVRIWTRRF